MSLPIKEESGCTIVAIIPEKNIVRDFGVFLCKFIPHIISSSSLEKMVFNVFLECLLYKEKGSQIDISKADHSEADHDLKEGEGKPMPTHLKI